VQANLQGTPSKLYSSNLQAHLLEITTLLFLQSLPSSSLLATINGRKKNTSMYYQSNHNPKKSLKTAFRRKKISEESKILTSRSSTTSIAATALPYLASSAFFTVPCWVDPVFFAVYFKERCNQECISINYKKSS
jgi:hypothetical protein